MDLSNMGDIDGSFEHGAEAPRCPSFNFRLGRVRLSTLILEGNVLSAASLDGQILQNCYRIEKRVGKGGMAWVYKAHHTVLNVPVAIKILLPSLAEEESIRQRFITEARVMFQLQHPHIVQVTDIIQEGDIIGMVMEWVDGEDLNQWLKRQTAQVTWKQLWKLTSPLLGAMDYIHRKGFVHRDLKLSNIMLHYGEGEPVLKVADFGLVKVLDDMAEEHLTQTGTRMGTVAYMSPEQIKDAKTVGTASDIYSLGIVLYKLITRKLPFTGDIHYVIFQHMDSIPPFMREHRDDIPPMVDSAIMRCLSKEPTERWETCSIMAEAIRQSLLESGCLKEDQAQMFYVSGDPDAAENTWHSTSPKRFSEWDKTQPEWMREQAYGSELHRSQSGLTVDDTELASEMTQIGEEPRPSSSKVPWMALVGVLLLAVAVGAWWVTQRRTSVIVPPPRRITTRVLPQRPRVVVPTPLPRKMIQPRVQPLPSRRLMKRQPVVRPRRRPRLIRSVLVIESSPRAEVWKGSRRLGKTPYRWKGKPGQKVRWILKQKGFQSKKGQWRFSRTRLTKTRYELQVRIVSLVIRSEPSGASVLIRGRNVGKTPYTFRGKEGSRVSFVLRIKGKYKDQKGSTRLLSNGTKTQRFKLKPFMNDPFK